MQKNIFFEKNKKDGVKHLTYFRSLRVLTQSAHYMNHHHI